MKAFETVKQCNLNGAMSALRLNHFDINDFQALDAPQLIPSGSMESWTSAAYPVAQGAFLRSGEENVGS